MSSSINIAWLDPALTSAQGKAFDDAWDVLIVQEEWRSWVREYLINPHRSDALDQTRARRQAAPEDEEGCLHAPTGSRGSHGGRSGDLIALYLDVIYAIYSKWAQVSACPPPPPVTS
jgi:hypothetical protein